MTVPKTIAAEYARAIAAEKALGDRITALPPVEVTQAEYDVMAATIVALDARVTALEHPVVVVPPDPTDPAWAVALRARCQAVVRTDQIMPSGNYTGAQINAAIKAADGKRLIVNDSIVNLSGDEGLSFKGRTGVMLDLTGTTVFHSTDGTSNLSSALFFEASVSCGVRGGTIIGQMTGVGTQASWNSVNEHINGAIIRAGCKDVELDGVVMQSIRGWPIFVAGIDGTGGLADGVWVHGGGATGGETSVAIVAGQNIIVEDGQFSDATYYAIDFEPDTASGHIRHVLIQRNTFDRWGWRGLGSNYYFAAFTLGYTGPPFADMADITIRDNTIPHGDVLAGVGGLRIIGDRANIKTDIVITGNVSSDPRTVAGGGVDFSNTTNLTVTGNTQVTKGHVPLVNSDINPSGVHVLTPNAT